MKRKDTHHVSIKLTRSEIDELIKDKISELHTDLDKMTVTYQYGQEGNLHSAEVYSTVEDI